MVHNERGVGGSRGFWALHPFVQSRGVGQEKRAVQIYFWNSFLIKYFGFAEPMNCWLTQTSEELKFKCAWASWWLLSHPELPVHWGSHPVKQWETRCLQGSSLPTSQEARLPGPHPHSRCPCSNARLQIRTKVFPQTFHSLKLLPSMQFSQGDVAYLSRLKSGNSPRNPIFQKEKKNLDSSPWSLTCPRHWPPYRGSFSVGNTHSKAPRHPQSSSWGSRTTCTHEL